jgi:uncharacterized protein (DUF1684 family)
MRARSSGGIRALLLPAVLFVACSRPSPEDRAYVAALVAARAQKDALFRTDAGPLPPAARTRFLGLEYYDPDPRWIVTAAFERTAVPDTVRFVTSKRTFDTFLHIGRARFELRGKQLALSVYESLGDRNLFVPFTDLTTGKQTYGAGRYLDPEPGPGETLTLDFNRAYNPYCAYDASWVCPVPPAENHLEIAVVAGEKVDGHGH